MILLKNDLQVLQHLVLQALPQKSQVYLKNPKL